ncbi:MAG: glycosyltransferase family 2 protein [Coriobacteriales bacterium]|nr:glycosyltransferase family 2 protein [Coriobacteriales bacterium]
MNPIIVIPVYIGSSRKGEGRDVVTTYDHVTPLGNQGELPRCLMSLRDNNISAPIYILVVSEPGIEQLAAVKVRDIADNFIDTLDVRVIDQAVLDLVYARMDLLGLGGIRDGVALKSYGSIRNFGLIIAAAHGASACIFIDDDEIVDTPDFVERATYGMGKLTRTGIPILIKSGFHTDRQGNWLSKQKSSWYNRFWPQGELFNKWMKQAMGGARLSRSNNLYGGLCVIHREAFRRVCFDPWIPRGEDLDYLLNASMYGGGVWFDNQLSIVHAPPKTPDESQRFRQDIYRWIYEHSKLEYAKSQIDLLPIQSRMLDPYPGPFLEHSINRRVFITALLRALGRGNHRKGYVRAALAARREAKAYAEVFCPRYYEFQIGWPQVVATFEMDRSICNIITGGRCLDKSELVQPVTGEETAAAGDGTAVSGASAAGDVAPPSDGTADDIVGDIDD